MTVRALFRGSRIAGLCWVAALIWLPAYLAARLVFPNGLPRLPWTFGWVVIAFAAWIAIAAAIVLTFWVQQGAEDVDLENPRGAARLSAWGRRTGIAGADLVGFFLCVAAVVLYRRDDFWVPIALIPAAAFAVSAFLTPIEQWILESSGRTVRESGAASSRGELAEPRQWTWDCRSRPLQCDVGIDVRTDATRSRRLENPSRSGLGLTMWAPAAETLARDGADDQEVKEVARQLLTFTREHRFNYFEEAQNTLQLVQSIPYVTDQVSLGIPEYWRFPLETLFDNQGDCDCKAILAAALFRSMGLRSVVLLSPVEGHAAVAVEGAPDYPGNQYFEWAGGRYFFCETTDGTFGFTVGEVPPNVNLQDYTVRVEIPAAAIA